MPSNAQPSLSAWQIGDTFTKIAPFPTGETLVLDKIRDDGRLEISRPSGARQLVPAEMLERYWRRVASCISCGGNDGYGPAPHHEPGCYFASQEDDDLGPNGRLHQPHKRGAR